MSEKGKLDFISTNYLHSWEFYFYPILAAAIILLIIPFLSNGAYWLHLKFKQWKKNQRNKIENKSVLTLKESIQLRKQIREQANLFNEITDDKDKEIEKLTLELTKLQVEYNDKINLLEQQIKKTEDKSNNINISTGNQSTINERDTWDEDLVEFKRIYLNTSNDLLMFKKVYEEILTRSTIEYLNKVEKESTKKLYTYELLEPNQANSNYPAITPKFKYFAKKLNL